MSALILSFRIYKKLKNNHDFLVREIRVKKKYYKLYRIFTVVEIIFKYKKDRVFCPSFISYFLNFCSLNMKKAKFIQARKKLGSRDAA